MTLTGAEIFTVTDGASPPRQKRLADMTQFEVLCVANHGQRNGRHARRFSVLSAEQRTWRTSLSRHHHAGKAPRTALFSSVVADW